MIYMNNASMGQASAATLARMEQHSALETRIGVVAAMEAAQDELRGLRPLAAGLLGTPGLAERIGVETTTTAAWTAILMTRDLRGKTILVAPDEWGANLRLLERLIPMVGGVIERLPPLGAGGAGVDAWGARIGEHVAALVMPLVSSVQGRLYPMAEIGALPRPEGCMFLVDAAQAFGQVPIGAEASGIDAIVGTTRKWLQGPRGTSLYWTAPGMGDLCLPAVLCPSVVNIGNQLGLSVALSAAKDTGIDAIRDQIMARSTALFDGAAEIGLATASGLPPDTGTVCLAIPMAAKERVEQALSAAGIAAKMPDPARDEPFSEPLADGYVPLRLAPHRDTDSAAIDQTLAALKSAI